MALAQPLDGPIRTWWRQRRRALTLSEVATLAARHDDGASVSGYCCSAGRIVAEQLINTIDEKG